jgi:hypothetical protein
MQLCSNQAKTIRPVWHEAASRFKQFDLFPYNYASPFPRPKIICR